MCNEYPSDFDGFHIEGDDDEDADCSMCGGRGWDECDDEIQCTAMHNCHGECPCVACGGSGLAKDQTIF